MKKHRFLTSAIILVSAFALSGICVQAAPTGSGTKASPYKIETADDLSWFAGLVNGTLTDGTAQNKSACAILEESIVVNEVDLSVASNRTDAEKWTPIGNESNVYDGTFDGNDKTISGIYLTGNTYAGLFGHVSGEIKNLDIANSFITVGKNSTGASIAAVVNDGVIINCSSSANLEITGIYGNIGGIVGKAINTEIDNCSYSGRQEIPFNKSFSWCQMGGIAAEISDGTVIKNSNRSGYMYISPLDSRSGNYGGIAGYNNGCEVTDCYNTGSISNYSRNNEIGGIVGKNSNGAYVKNCYNTAGVGGADNSDRGGIVGLNDASYVINCHNSGKVTDTDSYSGMGPLGGIAGVNTNKGVISGCYNTCAEQYGYWNRVGGIVGDVMRGAIVENCYNSGRVESNRSVTGGIAASTSVGGAIIRNCYNTGDVRSINSSASGGILGSSSDLGTIYIQNCFNTGVARCNADKAPYPHRISGSDKYIIAENCYYLSDAEEDTLTGTTAKTAEQFASGEVAYLLNSHQYIINYYQTIGEDSFPGFDGKRVYFCSNEGYCNLEEGEIPESGFITDYYIAEKEKADAKAVGIGTEITPVNGTIFNKIIFDLSNTEGGNGEFAWEITDIEGNAVNLSCPITFGLHINEVPVGVSIGVNNIVVE